jgi:nucleotide-binding universal stress UspA family protein
MYRKIAVPLDGSPLAEQALPLAVTLAKLFNSELLLVRVKEVAPLMTQTIQHETTEVEKVRSYLEQVKRTLTTQTELKLQLPFDRVTLRAEYSREVAVRLIELNREERVDLIVMTSHGYSGFSQFLLGGVASSLLHYSNLPVMMVRPAEPTPELVLPQLLNQPVKLTQRGDHARLVVALDGSLEAESALAPALELARGLDATIYLMRVAERYAPNKLAESTINFLSYKENQRRREEAFAYLDNLQARITEKGIDCIKVVRLGEPVEQILEYLKWLEPSLLVMSTHARGRLGRLVLGSISQEIVGQSQLPVLLVPTSFDITSSEIISEVISLSGV